MSLLAVCLLGATLTRAEAIERFRAEPISMASGFVEVSGWCPASIRRAYQLPVANFAAHVVKKLEDTTKQRAREFSQPGLVLALGEGTGQATNVLVRVCERRDGSRFVRLTLPDPATTDRAFLQREIVKAYCLLREQEVLDDAAAERRFRATDPKLRLIDRVAEFRAWREEGRYAKGKTDADYLRQMRTVLSPGEVLPLELEIFASRLYLYPAVFSEPFAGVATCCSFVEAIALAHEDAQVREMAARKAQELMIFGSGRGAKMTTVALGYASFLAQLAQGKASDEDLLKRLNLAEEIYKGVADEIRNKRDDN